MLTFFTIFVLYVHLKATFSLILNNRINVTIKDQFFISSDIVVTVMTKTTFRPWFNIVLSVRNKQLY